MENDQRPLAKIDEKNLLLQINFHYSNYFKKLTLSNRNAGLSVKTGGFAIEEASLVAEELIVPKIEVKEKSVKFIAIRV